jgi:hypothetical protein
VVVSSNRGAYPRADGTVCGVALTRREALAVPARYTDDRKRQIVQAIERGVIKRSEAYAAHRLSAEELGMWFYQFGSED